MFGIRHDILVPMLVSAFAFSLEDLLGVFFPVETAFGFASTWLCVLMMLRIGYALNVHAYSRWMASLSNGNMELTWAGKWAAGAEVLIGFFVYAAIETIVHTMATGELQLTRWASCILWVALIKGSLSRSSRFLGTGDGRKEFVSKFGAPAQAASANG